MPNCNICHRPIDPGERVAFHNNGTCHFRCLSKEDREELEGSENLQRRMREEKEARQKKENQEESARDKQEAMKRRQEILKEVQDRDKDRSSEEAEQDKNDRAQIDRLQKIQKMMGSKNKEDFEAAKKDFSKTINLPPTKSPEEILKEARAQGDDETARKAERLIREKKEDEEDAEKIRRAPLEACVKCGRPASNNIDGKYYCREHSFGEFGGGTKVSGAPKVSEEYIRKEAEAGMKKHFCLECGDLASIQRSGNWYCWVHDPEMRKKAAEAEFFEEPPHPPQKNFIPKPGPQVRTADFVERPPPPPPRIIPVRAPAPIQILSPRKTSPIISRSLTTISKPPVSRGPAPLFQFSSVNEVKCPFCGSSRFLRVLERHGGEIEYECENPACA